MHLRIMLLNKPLQTDLYKKAMVYTVVEARCNIQEILIYYSRKKYNFCTFKSLIVIFI